MQNKSTLANPGSTPPPPDSPTKIDLSSAFVKQDVKDNYHNIMIKVYGDRYIQYRQLWDHSISGCSTLSHPLHVDLELFNACNYRCSFCPYSAPAHQRPRGFNVKGSKRLDESLIEKVLSEAKGRLFAVELGYNTEPLLHTQIVDIIKMCRHYGVLDIRMGTNGSLLENIDSDELINSGLTQLQVSIDAVDPETYLRSRQSNLYNKVVSSIQSFIQRRDFLGSMLPRLRVTYVMTPENKSQKEMFRQQWMDFADIIGFQDLITYNDVDLNVSSSGLKSSSAKDFEGCYMPKVRMSIRSDGTVHPCCTVPGMKLRIGNVMNDTLEDLWTSPAMSKIRKSHFEGSWEKNRICRECIAGTKT